MNRNEILSDIAVKIGLTDFDDTTRNSILDALAVGYGVNVTKKTMSDLLHGIDSIINLANMPRVSRNGHLKSIAETLGSTTLPDNQSRQFYLNKWLEYATSVVEVWILAGGSWDDSGYWMDDQPFNDGV